MATAEDYTLLILGIAGTLIITIVGGLVLRHLNIIGKTSEKAQFATINIGGMQEDFRDLKKTLDDNREHTDRKLDGILTLIEKKDEAVRNELRNLSSQNVDLDRKMIGMDYRLKALEEKASRGA